MTQTNLARVVNSTVEPLSDIARSNSWRQIEQALNEPTLNESRTRFPLRRVLVGFVGFAIAAAIFVVFAVRGSTKEAARSSESLVAEAGEHIDRSWAGGELTLHGPGAAELVHDGTNRLTVNVSEGAVVVRREASTSVLLSVRTSTLETGVTSAIFAVRVHLGATQMATGDEQVRRLLLAHELLEVRADDLPVENLFGEDVPVESVPAEDAVAVEATTTAPEPDLAKPKRRVEPTAKTAVRETKATEEPRPVEPSADLDAPAPSASLRTLEEIYTAAEQAMRLGDSNKAVKLLETIVGEDRVGLLAAPARYDLALLAIESKQHVRALRFLDELISSGRDPNLKKSARLLRCRVHKLQGKSCDE